MGYIKIVIHEQGLSVVLSHNWVVPIPSMTGRFRCISPRVRTHDHSKSYCEHVEKGQPYSSPSAPPTAPSPLSSPPPPQCPSRISTSIDHRRPPPLSKSTPLIHLRYILTCV